MLTRIKLITLGVSLVLVGLFPAHTAFAASPPTGPLHLQLYSNATTIPADGTTTAHMNIMAYTPYCADYTYSAAKTCPDGSEARRNYNGNGQKVNFYTSDNSVLLQGQVQRSEDNSYYYGTVIQGHSSIDFKVTATTPGTKTVTAVFSPENGAATSAESSKVDLTFTAVPKEQTSAGGASTSGSQGSTATPPIAGAPTAPTLDELTIDGRKIVLQDTTDITIKHGKSFTLKGKTIAKGTVNLYIHSTPKEATTVANDKGEWQYTVNDLEAGDHTVAAEVFDSASQKTSNRQQLLAFKVSKAAKSAVSTHDTNTSATTKQSPKVPLIIGAGILVVLIAGGIIWRRRRGAKHHQTGAGTGESAPTDDDTPPSSPTDEPKSSEH